MERRGAVAHSSSRVHRVSALQKLVRGIEGGDFRLMAIACTPALLLMAVVGWYAADGSNRPLVDVLSKSRTSSAELDEMTAGYYEDLLDQSKRSISANNLITGAWATDWTHWEFKDLYSHDRRRDDFLYYEMVPNLDWMQDGGRFFTNRFGMADQDYDVEKPEATRRLALIGDSFARGVGAPTGQAFEGLLEEALNARFTDDVLRRYEILNFGVDGYRSTQFVEVVLTKAAAFDPDVYVVALTDLSVTRKWSDHVAQLVHDGIDLKYPFLVELAEEARLRADDDPRTLTAKLAPYRLDVLRWSLMTIKDHASSRNADLLVLLVPSVIETDVMLERFAGTLGVVEELGLPVVDVLDTFQAIEDLNAYRISPRNVHPNVPGHRLLFERLLDGLRSNARAWRIVSGRPEG